MIASVLIAVAALIALASWWRQRARRQHPRASREQGAAGARPASRRRRFIDVLPNQCGDLGRMAARKKVIPAFDRDQLRPGN